MPQRASRYPHQREASHPVVARQFAIDDTELIHDRVWLARLDAGGNPGALVEQPLERTAYKDVLSVRFGLVVYQHRFFIAKLPPGQYVSYWLSTYPGVQDSTAIVYLNSTPR